MPTQLVHHPNSVVQLTRTIVLPLALHDCRHMRLLGPDIAAHVEAPAACPSITTFRSEAEIFDCAAANVECAAANEGKCLTETALAMQLLAGRAQGRLPIAALRFAITATVHREGSFTSAVMGRFTPAHRCLHS